jgi:hypothetical protein
VRPSCRDVGRSQRPDLPRPQRGAAAAVKQRQAPHEQQKPPANKTAPERCLIRRRPPRYPTTAFTSPTEHAGEPIFVDLVRNVQPAKRLLHDRNGSVKNGDLVTDAQRVEEATATAKPAPQCLHDRS